MPDHDDQAVCTGEDGLVFGLFAEASLEPPELRSEMAVVLADPSPRGFVQRARRDSNPQPSDPYSLFVLPRSSQAHMRSAHGLWVSRRDPSAGSGAPWFSSNPVARGRHLRTFRFCASGPRTCLLTHPRCSWTPVRRLPKRLQPTDANGGLIGTVITQGECALDEASSVRGLSSPEGDVDPPHRSHPGDTVCGQEDPSCTGCQRGSPKAERKEWEWSLHANLSANAPKRGGTCRPPELAALQLRLLD